MSRTPGPWFSEDMEWGDVHAVVKYADGSGEFNAGVAHDIENIDDARLIAAAPELLEALKQILKMYGPSTEYCHEAQAAWETVERAIAKAEGRS